ncbi:MAG: hypothetical protein ABI640_13725 [Gammaproteobacteria bacterium]
MPHDRAELTNAAAGACVDPSAHPGRVGARSPVNVEAVALSDRLEEHQDVAKIATRVAEESAHVNNFLFFAAESLPKVRHLIDPQ